MLLKETVQKQTGLVIVWLSSTWIFDPLAIISNSSIYVTLKIRTNFSYFSGVKKSITNECVYSPDVRKKYKKVYYVSKWIVNNILFQWKILCFSKTIYPQLWREGEIFILSPCYHIFSQFRSINIYFELALLFGFINVFWNKWAHKFLLKSNFVISYLS